jgi:hypothetical protein
MRELQSTFSQKQQPRSAAAKADSRVQTFAVYGAFLLIATIVFGTLSFRPF